MEPIRGTGEGSKVKSSKSSLNGGINHGVLGGDSNTSVCCVVLSCLVLSYL